LPGNANLNSGWYSSDLFSETWKWMDTKINSLQIVFYLNPEHFILLPPFMNSLQVKLLFNCFSSFPSNLYNVEFVFN